jgi:arsenate reductase
MLIEDRIHLDLYGIKNCDSCRHAQSWLKTRNVPFTFHDFRSEGLPEDLLKTWLQSAHGPELINRRSTTWRKLSEDEKKSAETNPVPLLLANPTLIKRPVITHDNVILDVGFSPASLEDYI